MIQLIGNQSGPVFNMTLAEMLEHFGLVGIIGLILGGLVVFMLLFDAYTSWKFTRQNRQRCERLEASHRDDLLEHEGLARRPWKAALRFRRRKPTGILPIRMFKGPVELPDHSPDRSKRGLDI